MNDIMYYYVSFRPDAVGGKVVEEYVPGGTKMSEGPTGPLRAPSREMALGETSSIPGARRDIEVGVFRHRPLHSRYFQGTPKVPMNISECKARQPINQSS